MAMFHIAMRTTKTANLLILAVITCQFASAQKERRTFDSMQASLKPHKIVTYKTVGERELTLHIFQAEGFRTSDSRPAFVAIHGGGWVGGTPQRFYPYANALVDKGYVGFSVEYSLFDAKKGITVFDCVKDGRAAIRYIRTHAKELGIDPNRIAVSGGSAGGHVAAGTALFDGIDHADDDLSVSCRPDALILLFPVIDTSAKGYGMNRIGEKWAEISPVDRVKAGASPTLVFHGDADKTTPYAGSKLFTDKMKEAGNVCELVTHPGGGHGHINSDMKLFDDAMLRIAAFLTANMVGGAEK
jgi:acetyl esterase